jgi:menaquinol-cytochrome c reductase iron-sulfur subunit
MNNSMEKVGRRDFFGLIVKGVGVVVGAMLAVPSTGYLLSPVLHKKSEESWVPVGNADKFISDTPVRVEYSYEKVDGWMRSTVSRYAFIVRRPEGFVAFSPTCTHLGCSVGWNEEQMRFACPCHGGVYNRDGKVLYGPPPKPLTRFETKVEEGKLLIRVV